MSRLQEAAAHLLAILGSSGHVPAVGAEPGTASSQCWQQETGQGTALLPCSQEAPRTWTLLPLEGDLAGSHLGCHFPRLPPRVTHYPLSWGCAGLFPSLFLDPCAVTSLMPGLASEAGSCLPSISTSPAPCQLSIKLAQGCSLPTFLAPQSLRQGAGCWLGGTASSAPAANQR